MRSFLGEHLRSQSFPNFDRKFIERRDSLDKLNAGRTGDSEIELHSGPMIGNISYPIGQTRWAFSRSRTVCRFGVSTTSSHVLGVERLTRCGRDYATRFLAGESALNDLPRQPEQGGHPLPAVLRTPGGQDPSRRIAIKFIDAHAADLAAARAREKL